MALDLTGLLGDWGALLFITRLPHIVSHIDPASRWIPLLKSSIFVHMLFFCQNAILLCGGLSLGATAKVQQWLTHCSQLHARRFFLSFSFL